VRDAVDALAAQDGRRKADGEVVWSWHLDADAKLAAIALQSRWRRRQ